MNGIFLDDERIPTDVTWIQYPEISWAIVRDDIEFTKTFKKFVELGKPFVVSFDHDLQLIDGDEITGYTILKSMIEYMMDNDVNVDIQCFFHTQNPIGKANMKQYWENYLNVVK